MTGRKPVRKTFRHPHVGSLTLTAQSMQLDGTPGQRIAVYVAEPGTPEYDALLLLDMTAPPPDSPAPAAHPEQPRTRP